MEGEVAIVARYSNNIMLCIINIIRIVTKRSFKAVSLAMRYIIDIMVSEIVQKYESSCM